MSLESSEQSEEARERLRRTRISWSLTILGGLVVLVAVLRVSSAGYGTHVLHDFAERRSYNMVKRDVHRVFPEALGIAAVGFGLAWAGARLRRS